MIARGISVALATVTLVVGPTSGTGNATPGDGAATSSIITTSSFTAPTIFEFTGAPQTFRVPDNIDTLFVQAVGGSGGSGFLTGLYQASPRGGAGGQVIASLSVTPGEVLQINVGGAGQDGPNSLKGDWQRGQGLFHIAQGGWNGGGKAGFSTYTYGSSLNGPFVGNTAGGGGGATDIRSCASPQGAQCPTSTRILVAGGGGGAGMDNGTNTTRALGGTGGVFADGSGAAGQTNPPGSAAQGSPPGTVNAQPGQGATPSTPGAGGAPTNLDFGSAYELGEYCPQGEPGQGGVRGAGKPGTADGQGGDGGSGHYAISFGPSTTFGGGGGGGGYTGGGGGGCGGFAWINTQYGVEWDVFPGTAAGGGGSSWVDPTRIATGTPQFGSALLTKYDGYVVIQGLRLGSTGAPQAFTFPANSAYLSYSLAGAQGGDYGLGNGGGRGATAEDSFIPMADDTVQINVGGGGQTSVGSASTAGAIDAFGGPPIFDVADDTYHDNTFAFSMGYNGGGLAVPLSYFIPTTSFGGLQYPVTGGGGATDLRICPPGTSIVSARTDPCGTPLVSAAGGGGSSVIDLWQANVRGGHGGCVAGEEPNDSTSGGAGRGGTQTAGGIGGGAGPSGSSPGQAGSAFTGGNGGAGDNSVNESRAGAGGGGGYFGGGGGGGGGSITDVLFHSPGAGGGGSSLVPAGGSCSVGTGPRARESYESGDGLALVNMPVLVPGQPPGVLAVSIDDTTAEVLWSPPTTFATATTALISYSDDTGATWSTPQSFPPNPPAYVTGLTAATPYMFRVSLQNSYGIGPVSPHSNIIHTPTAVPAQVTGVDDTAYPDSVWVTWSAPADNGKPIRSYQVRWSTDGGATWDDSASTERPLTAMMVGDLTAEDTYVFEVAAVNEDGYGPWSATTSPAITPIGIPDAPGTPIGSPSFQEIEWDWTPASIPGAPGNGQSITGYQLEVTDDSTGEVFTFDTGSTDDSFTNLGVFSGRPYSARVRAYNGDVPGDWSSRSAPVTADGYANSPTEVRGTPDVEAVTVTWDDPSRLSGGTLLGFRVDSVIAGTSEPWQSALTVGPDATSVVVPNLTPGAPYRFRVSALTRVPLGGGGSIEVRGAWSQPTFTVKPLAAPPPKPQAPSAPRAVRAEPGDGTIDVHWIPPESPGSFAVTDYQAFANPGNSSCLAVSPATTCRINGLRNGMSYTVSVRALNGAGWGVTSPSSPPVTPVEPTWPTLVIIGSRATISGRPGIRVVGAATGVNPGMSLRPWIRFPGQAEFTEGAARVTISDLGFFTWQRRTGKKAYVYLATPDDSLRSNRVMIPRLPRSSG